MAHVQLLVRHTMQTPWALGLMGYALVFVPILGMWAVHSMDGNIGNHLIAMNLILRPLEDINDPVWSVIISLIILLAGVFYVIVYILGTDERIWER